MRRLFSGAGIALAAKIVTGFAVVAIAATAAGAATEAAITGSANPDNWGQQVKAQVAACKAALAPGEHGIGGCVSAFAKQHGEQKSDEDGADGTAETHGNANANGHAKDKSKGHANGHRPDSAPEIDSGD